MTDNPVTITVLRGIPQVDPGDDLAGVLISALERAGRPLRKGDILVVTQKVVSKAEDRYLDLDTLTPSSRARELADITGKEPHLVEAVLSQSSEVLRAKPNVLIVETRTGLVMANAGIDQSNVSRGPGRRVLLLPDDADRSARVIKDRLDAHFGGDLGVRSSFVDRPAR